MTNRQKPHIPVWLAEVEIPHRHFRVLVYLWRHRPGFTPSGELIAKACKIRPNHLWPILNALEDASYLRREKVGKNKNTYAMLTPQNGPFGVIAEKGLGSPNGTVAKGGGARPNGTVTKTKRTRPIRTVTGSPNGTVATSPNGTVAITRDEVLNLGTELEEVQPPSQTETKLPEEALFWNGFPVLKKCRVMSTDRMRLLVARRKEQSWREGWREGIEKLAASKFATGTNDRGWTADFGWYLKPGNFAKTIEGNYDDRSSTAPVRRTSAESMGGRAAAATIEEIES